MKSKVRIAFAGTPEFAVTSLRWLHANHYNIVMVYTQPDKPTGRGQKIQHTPVKQFALENQLAIHQPQTLKTPAEKDFLQNLQIDFLIVVAYGLLLPAEILSIPKYGCINVHASLLPRWRGAAPIQHALLNGDAITGITIMQMDAGLDTGPILAQTLMPIADNISAAALTQQLSLLGAQSLIVALNHIQSQQYTKIRQNETYATYAKKLAKHDATLDWQKPAEMLARQVCAYNPWPLAQSYLNENCIRIWQAQAQTCIHNKIPGTILEANIDGIMVACGQNALNLKMIQLPNKRAQMVRDILNAYANLFAVGQTFRS